MKKVEIIVIGYNLPEIEAECIASVERNTFHPYLLTFFDNYGSGLTLTQVWNRLIENSKQDYICLLNNDTLVYPYWLTKLVETLSYDPDYAFAGPSTNNAGGRYQQKISSYEEACRYTGIGEEVSEPLVGFCLLFRKKTWRALGGFDERYTLYGQESDFIRRGQEKGYKQVWRHDSFVFHYGEASVKASGKNIQAERQKGRQLYWSTRKK